MAVMKTFDTVLEEAFYAGVEYGRREEKSSSFDDFIAFTVWRVQLTEPISSEIEDQQKALFEV